MNEHKRRFIAAGLALMLLVALMPSNFAGAYSGEWLLPAESYSKGPEYDFLPDVTAEEQLEDLFTTIDLQEASISELQSEMEAGHLTSEKLTQMYIDRINAYDKQLNLNSVIWINEDALADARELDEERAAGTVRGKLHGIPIIVKDNYNVAGMPNTAGSVALADLIADEDSGTVKKLRDAGAVIIGKANLSEFATSAIDSHSTLGGDAHNAYNPDRAPGGSSGGTGTAVRSNFAAAGLGTDTGGSIRNPASWSNLFGIRPSKGLTSISGVIPLVGSRDTTGPMAKTSEDLAIVLEAMAGTDTEDDYTVEAQADTLLGPGYSGGLSKDSLRGKRIAFLKSSFDLATLSASKLTELSEEITGVHNDYSREILPKPAELPDKTYALVRKARATMRKAGAEFVDLSDFLSDEEIYLYSSLNSNQPDDGYNPFEYEINTFLDKYGSASGIKTVKDILSTGPNVGYLDSYIGDSMRDYDLTAVYDRNEYPKYGFIAYGAEKRLRPTDWSRVLKFRKKVSDLLASKDIDAIMYLYFEGPGYDQTAEGYDFASNQSGYNFSFGPCLGLPDINVPMGFMTVSANEGSSSKGSLELPVGLCLVGRYGDEKNLIDIAYGYEQQAGSLIRKTPAITPALRDEGLNSYLDALMEEACAIDPDKNGGVGTSKMRKLYDAYNKALNADYSDPQSVYDASYELAVAYDKVVEAYNAKRQAAGRVLVKGQKIKDAETSMFPGVAGINNYSSDDKKVASVTKKGQITAKKAGKTYINALDKKSKKDVRTLSTNLVTVVNKPKLKFTQTYTVNDIDKEVNANKYLVSQDYDLLDVDKWVSSKPAVAVIDEKTGVITLKGKGSTRITAYFGNVKVSCTLKVNKAP